MKQEQVKELLLQSLEHERGGIQVYENAVACAINDDLHEEWMKYLQETRNHERILMDLLQEMKIDPETPSPGRAIVKGLGKALIAAMQTARANGDPDAAQLVACECVTLAETKDHLDWELISKCAEKATGETGKSMRAAADEVEDQEDEHLYHTRGWCRELWIKSLGLVAVLPPPEEVKQVKTEIGAARAMQAADKKR
jgi:rubrerythrin